MGSELEKIRLAFKPLRRLFGSTFARDSNAEAVESIQRAMIDAKLCCRTVNQRVTRVRGLLQYAKKKLVPPDVYEHRRDGYGPPT